MPTTPIHVHVFLSGSTKRCLPASSRFGDMRCIGYFQENRLRREEEKEKEICKEEKIRKEEKLQEINKERELQM